MDDQGKNDAEKPRGVLRRLLEVWQWLVVLLCAFLLLFVISLHYKLAAPGAPAILFWTTVVAGSLIVLSHVPAVIFRLPKQVVAAPYLALLPFLVLMGFTAHEVDAAWVKTPQGSVEATQRESERRAEIAAEARRKGDEALLREAQDVHEQVKQLADKLESCFTVFGHRLPALENSVRQAAHNPDAFEHIETLAIVPDVDGNNVAMRFRAENGFGAIRLGIIKASVDPDNCEIVSIQEDAELL